MITTDPATLQLVNNIRNTSAAFLAAYERCRGLWQPPPPGEAPRPIQILAFPMIVNLAFAVDTGAKALLTLHGTPMQGHELEKLLSNLPADVRQRIRPTNLPDDQFMSRLTASSKAFVEWRYWYEAKPGNQLIGDGPLLAPLAAAMLNELDKILTPDGRLR